MRARALLSQDKAGSVAAVAERREILTVLPRDAHEPSSFATARAPVGRDRYAIEGYARDDAQGGKP